MGEPLADGSHPPVVPEEHMAVTQSAMSRLAARVVPDRGIGAGSHDDRHGGGVASTWRRKRS